VLAQRAASEGPRWTRAVEDQSAPIPREKRASLEGTWISSDGAVTGSLGHSSKEKHYELNDPRLAASLVSPIRLSRFTVTDRSHPNMQGKVKLRPQ